MLERSACTLRQLVGSGRGRSKAFRASFTAKTKQGAVQKGRDRMAKANGQLIIHKADGHLQEERTYGKDPFPPKG